MQMDEKKPSVPKLRFPGFTDPWEQRKFGDMYRRAVEKNDGSFGEDKIISVANMHFKPVRENLSKGYLQTYNVMLPGDIAFEGNRSKHFAHGRFVENTIGPGIVSHVFEVFRPTSPYEITYWKYAINNEYVMRKILARATKASTMMHSLVAKDFLAEAVCVPSLREQARIGEFFARLDSLITLHQRKLEHLREMKRGLLQKMFPKDGESAPELRFPGFTDPWEQRKLGDLIEINSGRDYKHLENGGIPVYGTGGLLAYVNEALSYKKDAVGIGRKGTIDHPYKLKAPFWTVDTLFYAVPSSQADLDFVLGLFHRINWKSKDESTGLPSLSKKIINSVPIMAPLFQEQQKIGKALSYCDSLITLHQRKLEHLQEMKKGLLQQMFV